MIRLNPILFFSPLSVLTMDVPIFIETPFPPFFSLVFSSFRRIHPAFGARDRSPDPAPRPNLFTRFPTVFSTYA